MKSTHLTARTGFSLVEITIILLVLSIISAILVPVISVFIHKARVVRAREDVRAIGMSIWMYISDTANNHFFQNGSSTCCSTKGPNLTRDNRVDMLVGDGDIPHEGPGGDAEWVRPVNKTTVDFMEYHLVTNNPGGNVAHHYRTPLDLDNSGVTFARTESAGFNAEFAWRGPYITGPIDPDPWGNRYAANVKFLDARADIASEPITQHGYAQDVVVISAGTDEELDTAWAVDGLVPGDDDILVTISANSRP